MSALQPNGGRVNQMGGASDDVQGKSCRLGPLIGAVDAGTATIRFLVFVASTGELVTYHQVPAPESRNRLSQDRKLEIDPDRLVSSVVTCIDATVANLQQLDIDPQDIVAVGITTQREAAFAWDRVSGKPWPQVPGILGQDTRAQPLVEQLLANRWRSNSGGGSGSQLSPEYVKTISGIPVSAHFTAAKYRWMLENSDDVAEAFKENRLLLGTADSYLIWALTNSEGGGIHMTDVTHASLTGLMNLASLKWDNELCNFYGVPLSCLPKIKSCSEVFGHLTLSALKGVPISGCIGDQQAALIGQNCWRPGQAKTTFGSGCFTVYNAGPKIVHSESGLISTVAYQMGPDASPVYALEGSVGVAGSALDWLKTNLGVIDDVSEIESYASQVSDAQDLIFVPAFSGHQSPRWMPNAKGLMLGLTHRTTKAHICRSALDAVAFQTRDVLDAMQNDSKIELSTLLVDGGMSSNNLLLQIQADVLGIPVLRPSMPETSAIGAAIVAGSAKGVSTSWDTRASLKLTMDTFLPRLTRDQRDVKYERWQKAVDRSLNWPSTNAAAAIADEQAVRSNHHLHNRHDHHPSPAAAEEDNALRSPSSSAAAAAGAGSNPSVVGTPRHKDRSMLTEKERRLRASIPAAIFALSSFIVWKIASSRS